MSLSIREKLLNPLVVPSPRENYSPANASYQKTMSEAQVYLRAIQKIEYNYSTKLELVEKIIALANEYFSQGNSEYGMKSLGLAMMHATQDVGNFSLHKKNVLCSLYTYGDSCYFNGAVDDARTLWDFADKLYIKAGVPTGPNQIIKEPFVYPGEESSINEILDQARKYFRAGELEFAKRDCMIAVKKASKSDLASISGFLYQQVFDLLEKNTMITACHLLEFQNLLFSYVDFREIAQTSLRREISDRFIQGPDPYGDAIKLSNIAYQFVQLQNDDALEIYVETLTLAKEIHHQDLREKRVALEQIVSGVTEMTNIYIEKGDMTGVEKAVDLAIKAALEAPEGCTIESYALDQRGPEIFLKGIIQNLIDKAFIKISDKNLCLCLYVKALKFARRFPHIFDATEIERKFMILHQPNMLFTVLQGEQESDSLKELLDNDMVEIPNTAQKELPELKHASDNLLAALQEEQESYLQEEFSDSALPSLLLPPDIEAQPESLELPLKGEYDIIQIWQGIGFSPFLTPQEKK